MTDEGKTKKQLVAELKELRTQLSDFKRHPVGKSKRKIKTGEGLQLLAIFDSIDEVVYVSDPDTYDVLYANQAIAKNFGDVTGKKCYYAFQGLDSPCEFCSNDRIFGKNLGQSYVWEFRNRLNNKWYRCIDKAIAWPDGRMVRYEMAIDISDQKLAEDALRRSEEKYRDLYDNAPDMYHSLDRKGFIIDCNETEAKMLGYKKEEIVGRHFTEFITEESKRLFERDFPKLNYEKTQMNLEREFIRKDGTTFIASLNVFSEFDQHGNLVRTKTIARDVTEIKKIEEDMLKIQKLDSVGVLAGGIAHDFNNILTAVLGNISLAAMYVKSGGELFKRLMEAEKAAMRAKGLTHQLLTFSKGWAPVRKRTSVKELIRDSVSLALRGSNIRGEFALNEDMWPVEIDEGQISQVLNNLILNAVHAMPEGGIIRVSAENVNITADDILPLKQGEYVKISVMDHGIGIPKENQQKVFEPFFTTKQKGYGLGLATAYSIVKKHEGYISLLSKLNLGTTFSVYLPASAGRVSEIVAEMERPVFGKGRVLIMDDEDVVIDAASEMLINLGYETGIARDGIEAINLYKKARESGTPYDAVIMDLTIPGGMGGKETVRKLLKAYPDVRVIVSSGYSNDPVMANYLEYGFCDVLQKPYKIIELSRTVDKVINKK